MSKVVYAIGAERTKQGRSYKIIDKDGNTDIFPIYPDLSNEEKIKILQETIHSIISGNQKPTEINNVATLTAKMHALQNKEQDKNFAFFKENTKEEIIGDHKKEHKKAHKI